MGKLQFPNFEALASRFLGVKGPGSLVELDPAMVANLPTWTTGPKDLWYLQGILAFRTSVNVTPVAAQYSYGEIFNPESSNRLVILRSVSLTQDCAQGTRKGSTSLGAFQSNGVTEDLRYNPLSQATGHVTTNAGVFASDAGFWQATTNYFHPCDVVLYPGSSLWFRTLTVNQSLRVGFHWWERSFNAGEVDA